MDNIRDLLIRLADKYETGEFVLRDPVQFPHRYRSNMDVEISAFVTSWLSFGQRRQILDAARIVDGLFNRSPSQFIIKSGFNRFMGDKRTLYRMLTYSDFYKLCSRLFDLYWQYKYFDRFLRVKSGNPVKIISDYFKGINGIPDFDKGSACKRICMFLRWMVRDSVVDMGMFPSIDKKDLIIPLDTHVHQTALKLGITKRKQADMKTAIEITEYFKTVFPGDPARGDFALFGAGINGDELMYCCAKSM